MRARFLKPGFFTNEELARCSPMARLLFAGLWLLADRAGRLDDKPPVIHGELFPWQAEVDVSALLDELAEAKFIKRYYAARGVRLIQVLRFSEHQHPHVRDAEPKTTPKGHLDAAGAYIPSTMPSTVLRTMPSTRPRPEKAVLRPGITDYGLRITESESESESELVTESESETAARGARRAPKGARAPSNGGAGDNLQWARSLREREGKGEKLTPVQREAWRKALRHESPAVEG